MFAFSISALFLSIALIVGFVLVDCGMKFVNAAKDLQRSAKADRLSNLASSNSIGRNEGTIIAQRVRAAAVFTAERRALQRRVPVKADALRVAA